MAQPLATPRERASPVQANGSTVAARAAVIVAPGAVRLETVAMRSPAAGEVRIRLEGSGVCASNLPLWQGREWFTYPQNPGAPGHEGWGTVDAIGPGVDGVHEGQRVAVLSYHAYAEFDIARAEHIVALPAELAHVPVPGEALGCAFNVFRRSGIEAGHDVAIIGVGFLGAVLTRLAADADARVIAISRRPFALDIARQLGAAETIPLGDHSRVVERVRELTSARWCQRVIEAVGLQRPLELAGELTAERGRLVIAGYHQDGPRQVNVQLWNWRGIDVVNAHERDPRTCVQGMREAVDALVRGVLDPTPLYTHQYALDRLDQALEATAERPAGFLKALVCT